MQRMIIQCILIGIATFRAMSLITLFIAVSARTIRMTRAAIVNFTTLRLSTSLRPIYEANSLLVMFVHRSAS